MARRSLAKRIGLLMASVPALVVGAGTGCYEYTSTALGHVQPGQTVHVVLSPSGSAALASTIGANATTLDGRILRGDSGELTLAVTQIERSVGPEEFMRDESITVPAQNAESVTVRRLDRPRTFLTIGAFVAGVFLAHVASNQAGVVTLRGGPASGTK
jgi:hypothetical protein